MKHKLMNIAIINGPMMIRVKDGDIYINAYQNEIKVPYQPIENPLPIEGVVGHRKGALSLAVKSDIFDVNNLSFKLEKLDPDTAKEIFVEMLDSSIQFIARIVVEENVAALIQTSYNESANYLYSTIGLVDDTRIIFAEIYQDKKKKKEKVKINA